MSSPEWLSLAAERKATARGRACEIAIFRDDYPIRAAVCARANYYLIAQVLVSPSVFAIHVCVSD